jgi:hypothetical protein
MDSVLPANLSVYKSEHLRGFRPRDTAFALRGGKSSQLRRLLVGGLGAIVVVLAEDEKLDKDCPDCQQEQSWNSLWSAYSTCAT